MTANASGDVSLEHPLVRRSFHDEGLKHLVELRDEIQRTDTVTQPYLKWALLGALRECASVKVGWPYQRPAIASRPRFTKPKRAFARRIKWICEDLENRPESRGRVVHGDSRKLMAWRKALMGRTPGAILTSPPYLNNFDYADATRLELYFWRDASSWAEMVQRVRSGMIISTTQQSSVRAAQAGFRNLKRLCPTSAERIELITTCLRGARKARGRGKEYDRAVPAYFSDMSLIFRSIAAVCEPKTPLILVVGDSAPYGIYIDTPEILTRIANEMGFSEQQTETVRLRGSRWIANGSRHQVPLREDLIFLQSPS